MGNKKTVGNGMVLPTVNGNEKVMLLRKYAGDYFLQKV